MIFHQYLWLVKESKEAMEELGGALQLIYSSDKCFSNLFVAISEETDKEISKLNILECIIVLNDACGKELEHYEAYDSK